jgi:hypothetical protein
MISISATAHEAATHSVLEVYPNGGLIEATNGSEDRTKALTKDQCEIALLMYWDGAEDGSMTVTVH